MACLPDVELSISRNVPPGGMETQLLLPSKLSMPRQGKIGPRILLGEAKKNLFLNIFIKIIFYSKIKGLGMRAISQ